MNSRAPAIVFALCLGLLTILGLQAAWGVGEGAAAVQAGTESVHAGTVTETLMALYDSTKGPWWTHNDGWGTSVPFCNWYGVTCSAGEVTELSLYANNLVGTVPSELGDLSTVQRLNLGLNGLIGTLPAELGNLSNVQWLSLYANGLSGSIPTELGNLSSVEYLNLSGNSLIGTIPAELGNLGNLIQLELYSNNLTGAIPAALGNLRNLRDLYLLFNNLSNPIPAALRNLSNLATLRLDNNPELTCWQTAAALEWALGLPDYMGPDAVCSSSCYLPTALRAYSPLTNGGFEDGWAGWSHGGSLPQMIVTEDKHSGTYSARLGDSSGDCEGDVPEGEAWIERTISVPAGGASYLRIHYRIVSEDQFSGDDFDRFEIYVNGIRVRMDGDENAQGCDPGPKWGDWEYYDAPVTPFQGTNITLKLVNVSADDWFRTWTYVDDIQFVP